MRADDTGDEPPEDDQDEPTQAEPWAKTSSGDADSITEDDEED